MCVGPDRHTIDTIEIRGFVTSFGGLYPSGEDLDIGNELRLIQLDLLYFIVFKMKTCILIQQLASGFVCSQVQHGSAVAPSHLVRLAVLYCF